MSRVRNWLADQSTDDWRGYLLGGLGYLLATGAVSIISMGLLYWWPQQVTLSMYAVAFGATQGVVATVWFAPYALGKLSEWAAKKPAQPLRDFLKEEALRELNSMFPADKE